VCLITWNGLQTHTWHHLHSLSRHNWQYLWFWKTFFCSFIFYPVYHPSTHISARPYSVLPVLMTGLYIKLCEWTLSLYSHIGNRNQWILRKQLHILMGHYSRCSYAYQPQFWWYISLGFFFIIEQSWQRIRVLLQLLKKHWRMVHLWGSVTINSLIGVSNAFKETLPSLFHHKQEFLDWPDRCYMPTESLCESRPTIKISSLWMSAYS